VSAVAPPTTRTLRERRGPRRRCAARPYRGYLRHRERGAALFVVLVLLMTMLWFALSAFRIGGQGIQIVGNVQAEHQATAAAQRAIDQTISSNLFTKDPAAVAAAPIPTDIDGDGSADFTAQLDPVPKCYRVRPIKTMELDIDKAADRVCLQSSGGTGNLFDVPGAPVGAGDSLCAYSEWNVGARVNDPVTRTNVAVSQGVGIRVEKANADNYCK
jgi:hypothetical protein